MSAGGARPLWPAFAETWIENWPEGLAELSFPQRGLRLGAAQANALGRRNEVHRHWFAPDADHLLPEVERRLDALVRAFPGGAFIRLGSRSPKDSILGVLTQCRAADGAEALRLLTSRSRRVAFDLHHCLRAGYDPWVFARQWASIPPETEFRCFMRGQKLVGVTQYQHDAVFPGLNSLGAAEGVAAALAKFFPAFVSRCGGGDVVFDVCVRAGAESPVTLIELNPFGPPTDPCLFSWQDSDFDHTLRLRGPGGVIAEPLRD